MARLFSADSILLGTLGLLLISGVLTPAEALSGFASPGVATIAVLYGLLQDYAKPALSHG